MAISVTWGQNNGAVELNVLLLLLLKSRGTFAAALARRRIRHSCDGESSALSLPQRKAARAPVTVGCIYKGGDCGASLALVLTR